MHSTAVNKFWVIDLTKVSRLVSGNPDTADCIPVHALAPSAGWSLILAIRSYFLGNRFDAAISADTLANPLPGVLGIARVDASRGSIPFNSSRSAAFGGETSNCTS